MVAGKRVRAHRVAWELAVGPIPDGARVLHRCDVPACCRPEHLFLGSDGDNARDKVQKQRQARGARTRNGRTRSKLTEADVVAMRRLQGELTHAKLAEVFEIKKSQVHNILSGNAWKHA